MPGLSQLKKFNADILSLGNEPALRASRGEKPVTVPIPKSVKDVNDADDFVMGMPEPVENPVDTNVNDNAPEDFSDIMGLGEPSKASSETKEEVPAGPEINFAMPDITSLGAFDDAQGTAPDLSMFDEPVEEAEPEPEPEPEEPDIADMGLEALLGGAGFDGSEGEGEFEEGEAEPEALEEVESLEEVEPVEEISKIEEPDPFEDILGAGEPSELKEPSPAEATSLEEISDFAEPAPLEMPDTLSNPEEPEPFKDSDFGDVEGFNFDDLGDGFNAEPEGDAGTQEQTPGADEINTGLDEASPAEEIAPVEEDFALPEEMASLEEESTSGAEEIAPVDEQASGAEQTTSADDFSLDSLNIPDTDLATESEPLSEAADLSQPDDDDDEFAFDGSAIDMGEGLPESMTESDTAGADLVSDTGAGSEAEGEGFDEPAPVAEPVEEASEQSGEEDFSSEPPAGLFDSSDMEMPDLDSETAGTSDFDIGNIDIDAPDMSEAGTDFSEPDAASSGEADFAETADASEGDGLSGDDLSLPTEFDSPSDEAAPESEGSSSTGEDSSAEESSDIDNDFPSDFNFDLSDTGDDSSDSFQESAPSETFDTSEMEGLDFGIPDTDSALESGNFELGNSDDFAADAGEFEIPGFSDVQTVEVTKNGKIKVPTKEEEKEQAEDEDDLPPNTLTDEQYEKFIKNLSTYPLNVRMAVEELIVKNEFTDEAEFTIIQKVLKKVSARSLASELEKMLDIAISVPRDFERRTAEEYEAYKQSFQYQLSNKIIPGAIVSIATVVICFFLFEFARYFIYRPARANVLYRQGYTLLEQEDYPQSETKFSAATKFQLQKKWFFKYARGYRSHKQYIRAEQMYKNILYCFKFDKTAGLEYAEMETYELANYEAAEKILLRDVLDHHINDPDGILALGDNYLEWATEKDPEKYEEAVKRYSDLIQLYGATDKYLARMLRYYIRTDVLKEVLILKETFFPRPKSLEGCDWTELSGYCLEKLYGPLSPSDEYLRTRIEDVKEMLVRAVKTDQKNPVALYNLSKYYVNTNNKTNAEKTLKQSISSFENTDSIKKRDLYKFVDSYRLLGEIYVEGKDYLKALEVLNSGAGVYTNAKNTSGFEGNADVGHLFADIGDIEYFIAGDYDSAIQDYQDAVDTYYDNGQIRYKIGYIQYARKDYRDAIGSFMKSGEDYSNDSSLLLAMGNTLSLKNDNYAAEGYYERLLEQIDSIREQKGVLFPQVRKDEAAIVDTYMKASNNLGVTLFRLAKRTGSSQMNARAMVKLQESMRAWDSMTRNQQTLVRLGGSNLAEQNLKYVTHPVSDYEPAIYTDLPKTLSIEKGLAQ